MMTRLAAVRLASCMILDKNEGETSKGASFNVAATKRHGGLRASPGLAIGATWTPPFISVTKGWIMPSRYLQNSSIISCAGGSAAGWRAERYGAPNRTVSRTTVASCELSPYRSKTNVSNLCQKPSSGLWRWAISCFAKSSTLRCWVIVSEIGFGNGKLRRSSFKNVR